MQSHYFEGIICGVLVGFKRRKGGGRKEEGAPDLPPCLCLHLCPSLPVHPNTISVPVQCTVYIPIPVGLHNTLHQYPRLHLGADAVCTAIEGGPVYYLPLCLCISLLCASQWMRINRSASHYWPHIWIYNTRWNWTSSSWGHLKICRYGRRPKKQFSNL